MLPEKYKKVSFRRFTIAIDTEKLLNEYQSIPESAWAKSYWGDVHCSVGMLLLRGGETGTPEDFFCENVSDNPLLVKLPYISSLLAKDGPFGGAQYAFMFKTKPAGVTLIHSDLMSVWQKMYRIHVPIISNPQACLVANDRSQHFQVGYAWSFDNHSDHGVVNGDTERVHLIMDVPLNDKIKQCIDEAEYFPGEIRDEYARKIREKSLSVPSYPGDIVISRGITILRSQGLSDAEIANFMNSKGLPTKWENKKIWSPTTIAMIVPD